MNKKLKSGLVIVFLTFLVLMNQPLLQIPNSSLGNIPAILVYFLVFWIFLIITMRFMFNNTNREK